MIYDDAHNDGSVVIQYEPYKVSSQVLCQRSGLDTVVITSHSASDEEKFESLPDRWEVDIGLNSDQPLAELCLLNSLCAA